MGPERVSQEEHVEETNAERANKRAVFEVVVPKSCVPIVQRASTMSSG